MSCNRSRNINRSGQVMGEFGIPRIALRGPGCINGTGRCNVAGAAGRCTNVYGTGDTCDNVMCTGGRRDCYYDQVQGTGGNRNCFNDQVQGTGGRRKNTNVMGTGGRGRRCDCCCDWIWSYLETPTIVPR